MALLQELAGVSLTKTSLSRIELGKQPYSQPILEGLAIVYNTTVVALLAHNPLEAKASASLWETKLSRADAHKSTVTSGVSKKARPQKK